MRLPIDMNICNQALLATAANGLLQSRHISGWKPIVAKLRNCPTKCLLNIGNDIVMIVVGDDIVLSIARSA